MLCLAVWALLIRAVPLLSQAVLEGTVVRYHTGGLFQAFTEAIRANRYRLPATIPHYTYGGLPFVYPPLPFYVAAAIGELPGADSRAILVLNAVLSWLSVLAFVAFVYATDLSKWERIASVAAFATLPQGFTEHLPGEGLAESVGTLCFTLFVTALWRFAAGPSWKRIAFLGLLLGLCVLSSPGSAVAAPATLLISWGFALLDKAKRNAGYRLTAAYGAAVGISVVVASPYLLHIGRQFGFGRLLEAMGGQGSSLAHSVAGTVWSLAPLNWGIPLWSILALFGLSYCIVKRNWFWVLWTLFLAWVPREGGWLASVPLAVLAGYGVRGIATILLPGLEGRVSRWASRRAWQGAKLLLPFCFAAYAAVWVPLDIVLPGASPEGEMTEVSYVTEGEARYLASLRSTTPGDTTILMVGNENEWAPLLSGRTVLNVWFGTEWVPAKGRAIYALAVAVTGAQTAVDLYRAIHLANVQYPLYLPVPDLVYFSKVDVRPRNNPVAAAGLVDDLKRSHCFGLAYEDAHVAVFSLAEGCDDL